MRKPAPYPVGSEILRSVISGFESMKAIKVWCMEVLEGRLGAQIFFLMSVNLTPFKGLKIFLKFLKFFQKKGYLRRIFDQSPTFSSMSSARYQ